MKPIITERILERYLLAVGVAPKEVARIMGLDAGIEHKIAEGLWEVRGGPFVDEPPEHEYHAALGAVAMAEIAYEGQSTWSNVCYREYRDKILEAAGLAPEAWEAVR